MNEINQLMFTDGTALSLSQVHIWRCEWQCPAFSDHPEEATVSWLGWEALSCLRVMLISIWTLPALGVTVHSCGASWVPVILYLTLACEREGVHWLSLWVPAHDQLPCCFQPSDRAAHYGGSLSRAKQKCWGMRENEREEEEWAEFS